MKIENVAEIYSARIDSSDHFPLFQSLNIKNEVSKILDSEKVKSVCTQVKVRFLELFKN